MHAGSPIEDLPRALAPSLTALGSKILFSLTRPTLPDVVFDSTPSSRALAASGANMAYPPIAIIGPLSLQKEGEVSPEPASAPPGEHCF